MKDENQKLPSVQHARKMLMDYMDSKRPWSNCQDVYVMMEDIANYASFAFRNDHVPTKDEVSVLESDILKITSILQEHPDEYQGPCNCAECRDSQ